jgi:GH24 family phage-related lysozyme (muramidase)
MVFLVSGTEPKAYPHDVGVDVAGFGHTRFQPVFFFIVAEIV